jgi:FtsP/CotA-like multicopper oxidase with cupredoxin domain
MFRASAYGLLLPGLLLSSLAAPANESIAPNDNRQPAGKLENGVLTIGLEARTGTWRPEGEHGRVLDSLAAFAEVGKPLSTPGPLIRVPLGTEVRASLHNRLSQPLIVFGFGKSRGASDSVVVAPDATVPVSFRATTPGTFYYTARRGLTPVGRFPEDTQLNGFIIVDSPNAPPDRLFAISWLFTLDSTSRSGLGHGTMAINGLSWPHTEHLTYAQGDSIHWRVVNFTEIDHPMHLHGFYFRADSKGDGVTDSLYSAAEQRMAVTELMAPFQTLTLSWYADRPGNWIYHCHYSTHLSSLVALDTERGMLDSAMLGHHTSDRPHQMFGLVLGITVAPKGTVAESSIPPRRIRLIQREQPSVYGSQSGMSFVMDGTPDAADPTRLPVPGPTLFLERGKPVAVTIVNQSDDHAAVHWHGIELQSYPDGVPGWSGSTGNILPAIQPHDSLTVRWTPPRAGSFMYHSHFNEAKQMGSGLYGSIIVLEPGQRFDPETDKLLFLGTAGTGVNVIAGPFPDYLLNGKAQPEAMTLKAGTRYRFRLFNLAGDFPTLVSLNQGEQPVSWRAVAKDGYPLPPSQATFRPAVLLFDPGEIYDFEYTPATTGELVLKIGLPPFITQPPPGPPPPPGAPAPPAPPPFPKDLIVAVHVR